MSGTPDTVGWQFIEQYYLKLNTDPKQLYRFYNRASLAIHGNEAESVSVAQGQKEVNERVIAEDFVECKVKVSTVDCLPSAQDGIFIQVLGEMANKGKNPEKFAQSFFLARQAKGFFVLNDILRFIREDSEVGESAVSSPASVHVAVSPAQTPVQVQVPPQAQAPQAPQVQAQAQAPAQAQTPQAQAASAPSPSVPSAPPALPVSAPAPPAAAAAAAPDGPPIPPSPWKTEQTWANVVGQPMNGRKPPTVGQKQKQTQEPQDKWKQPNNQPKEPKNTKPFFSAYIKNVTPETNEKQLHAALENFGKVTHLQIEAAKGRAFVDFIDRQSLDRALVAHTVTAGSTTVIIDERKRRKQKVGN